MNLLPRTKLVKIILPATAIVMFGGGVAALAIGAGGPKSVNSTAPASALSQYNVQLNSDQTETIPNSETLPDGCKKIVTQNQTGSGQDITNTKNTTVKCELQGSNSSLNINSSSNQTTVTGDSTGQSGNASNNDSTIIDID